MKILKFNDGVQLEADLNFNSNLVTIKDANVNTSGFLVYSMKGNVLLRDASDYTTLYDKAENEYTLSNDGSVKPAPPEPPKPPKPVKSTLEVDGTKYPIYDFSGSSFKTALGVDEATAIFEDVTEFKVDGVLYEHLVFISAITDGEFTLVSFRQKSETEVSIEELQAELSATQEALLETFESQELLSEEVTNNSEAIIELYEMIIPEEE